MIDGNLKPTDDGLGVLHIVAPAEFGGLERVVHALAVVQHGAGHDVHVAAVLDSAAAHPFVEGLRAAGVPVHPLVYPGRQYGAERRAVAELCRRLNPAVVHTHGYRTDVVDAGAARRLGIATATTVHGFTGGGWKNRFYERLQLAAFRRFDAVVAVSRPLEASLARRGVRAERLHRVPNAWAGCAAPLDRSAARRALGVEGDRYHIGWVGRLSGEKAPDVLVDALARLRDLDWSASFVGAGRERAALEARAAAAGLGDAVRWHGLLPDADRLFAGFDVFVLSSRTEGTPIVLFEAMAAGVPIVATRVGGVPDVVTPAEALLVPPEAPAALAAAIRAVHDEPAAAASRAQSARRRLEAEYGVAPWLARYEAIYRGLLRSPPVQGRS